MTRATIYSVLISLLFLSTCERPKQVQPVTLRIGIFPVQDILPYLVMQGQGFGKQNGIQFEEVSYKAGTPIIDALVAGSVDVGYTGVVPAFSAAGRSLIPGAIMWIAANTFSDPEHASIGVLAGPLVKNWKDLDRKQIAVTTLTGLQSAALKARLRKEGVRDYTLVDISHTNTGLAVAGGNVAAAAMSEPFFTQSLLRGDGKLLGWVVGGSPFERMQGTVIIFGGDFYRKNPQAVKAFLRAQLQAVKWINENTAQARLILAKHMELTKDVD